MLLPKRILIQGLQQKTAPSVSSLKAGECASELLSINASVDISQMKKLGKKKKLRCAGFELFAFMHIHNMLIFISAFALQYQNPDVPGLSGTEQAGCTCPRVLGGPRPPAPKYLTVPAQV